MQFGPLFVSMFKATRIRVCAFLLVASCLPIAAHAQVNKLTNGGFETGNLSGWIVAPPSVGAIYNGADPSATPTANFYASSSTTAPVSNLATLGPKSGSFYALSDMNAASNVALLQSFTASSSQVNIQFDMYVQDWSGASAYDSAAGLNYNTTNRNQAARVDLLFSSAVSGGGMAYYTTVSSAIAATLYGPGADMSSQGPNPTTPSWTHYNQTVAVTLGQTYYIRYGVVDNRFVLNQAIDNVFVADADTPEPSTVGLFMTLLPLAAALVTKRCQRRRFKA